jgi:hypothetical protein
MGAFVVDKGDGGLILLQFILIYLGREGKNQKNPQEGEYSPYNRKETAHGKPHFTTFQNKFRLV